MIDEETAKKLVGLAGLGFGLTSGNRANYGIENAPASTYQGGIPEYDFVREQVLDTYDPDRVPGSRGQRYFSDARFVPAGSAGTADVRQELFNQANVGPDSLRAANYARMGKEVPDLAGRGPTGIASIVQQPTLDPTTGIAPPEPEMATITDPNQLQFFGDGVVYVPGYGVVNYLDDTSLLNYLATQNGDLTAEEPYFGTRYDEEKNFSEEDYTRISREGGDPNEDGFITNDEWTNWMLSKGPDEGFEEDYKRKLEEVLATGALKPETKEKVENYLSGNMNEGGSGSSDVRIPPDKYRTATYEDLIKQYIESAGSGSGSGYSAEGLEELRKYLEENFPDLAPPRRLLPGIGGFANGGYLEGVTDGMADAVPASIEGDQPAALSDGEFVVPADVVSHLGNGNSDAGAKQLYSMMDRVRKARTGTTKQGKEINPKKYMPRGIA